MKNCDQIVKMSKKEKNKFIVVFLKILLDKICRIWPKLPKMCFSYKISIYGFTGKLLGD